MICASQIECNKAQLLTKYSFYQHINVGSFSFSFLVGVSLLDILLVASHVFANINTRIFSDVHANSGPIKVSSAFCLSGHISVIYKGEQLRK